MVDQMVPFEGPNARLNITFGGQNGDYPDPVSFDATDADVKQIATEAIRTGYIPGIPADGNVDIQDFVVDRFPATDELPPRLMLRPKTPFGLSKCPVCGYFAFNGEECFDCGYRP
jgi:hypothetical protein